MRKGLEEKYRGPSPWSFGMVKAPRGPTTEKTLSSAEHFPGATKHITNSDLVEIPRRAEGKRS